MIGMFFYIFHCPQHRVNNFVCSGITGCICQDKHVYFIIGTGNT